LRSSREAVSAMAPWASTMFDSDSPATKQASINRGRFSITSAAAIPT
jgi:hypothetical protein